MDTRKIRTNTMERIAVGILLIVVSLLMLLSVFGAFGSVGEAVGTFWIGTFGLFGYGLGFALLIIGLALVFNIKRKRSLRNLLKHSSLFLFANWGIHIYTSAPVFFNNVYGEYLKQCYYTSQTSGGVLLGIPSWPLMKALTPVGALVIMAVLFFALLFFAYVFPYIRHNVTYSSSSTKKKRKEEPIQTSDTPTITTFNSETPGQTYTIDVEGADSRLSDKHAKGADGYIPMQSSSTNFLNEAISEYESNRKYETQQDLARDILFGEEVDPELLNKYKIAANPNLALQDIGAPYSAVKRQNFREKLGWNEEDERKEFMSRYVQEPTFETPKTNTEEITKEEKPQPQPQKEKMAMPSFFDLKAEQEQRFRELSLEEKKEEPPVQKHVVQPTKVIETPVIFKQDKKQKQDSDNMSGLRGVINRVGKHEEDEKHSQPNKNVEVEAVAYEKSDILESVAYEKTHTEMESVAYNKPQDAQGTQSTPTSYINNETQQVVYQETKDETPIINFFTNKEGNKVLQEEASHKEKPIKKEQEVQQPQHQIVQPIVYQTVVQQPVVQEAPKQKVEAKPIVQKSALDTAPPLNDAELMYIQKQKEEKARRESLKDKEFEKKIRQMEKIGQEPIQSNIQMSIDTMPKRKLKPYKKPPMTLLEAPQAIKAQDDDVQALSTAIETALESFNIDAKVIGTQTGPTFTLYTCEVNMPRGKSVGTVSTLEPDLAMHMEKESVRILAPIPGKNAIGIEVPNKYRSTVTFSEIIQSKEFKEKSIFAVGVGKDLYGKIHVYDFPKFPHLLVAGATGQGKSCCLNTLICSLLYKAGPEDLRMILIDPKRTEFGVYNGIPHLLTAEAICDVDKAIRALNWAVSEMTRRMDVLQASRCRDLDEYNRKAPEMGFDKLPKILVVVDELADLMDMGKKPVEEAVNRIARLARATGIHLVLATQRPSVDVISGTIKNNLPTRIACKVTQAADSKTVLDYGGAEKLLGMGDLLYRDATMNFPARVQGAFISNDEVINIVNYIKDNNESYFDPEIRNAIYNEPVEVNDDAPDSDALGNRAKRKKREDGEMTEDMALCIKLCMLDGVVSTSALQRGLGFGYPRAARAFEDVKRLGILGEPDAKGRLKLMISKEEAELLIQDFDTDI